MKSRGVHKGDRHDYCLIGNAILSGNRLCALFWMFWRAHLRKYIFTPLFGVHRINLANKSSEHPKLIQYQNTNFAHKRSWSECPEAPSLCAGNPPLNENWPDYPRHASTRSRPLVAALQWGLYQRDLKKTSCNLSVNTEWIRQIEFPPRATRCEIGIHMTRHADKKAIDSIRPQWRQRKLISVLRFETSKTVPKTQNCSMSVSMQTVAQCFASCTSTDVQM